MDATATSSMHRKRLAQILRYIASMHQTMSKEADDAGSFVKETPPEGDFFQSLDDSDNNNGFLFSTYDFQQLMTIQRTSEKPLFPTPPFSFYAAASGASTDKFTRKRTLTGALKTTFSFGSGTVPDKACWLRITRLTNAQVWTRPEVPNHAALQTYLDDWMKRVRVDSIDKLLTMEQLQKAPKVPPTLSARDAAAIKRFLDRYLAHLQKKMYQTALEPIYNALFEWTQLHQDHNQELVWGLGQAQVERDGTYISGPLLEVLVEVELASDGALLVRPREHTGVSLNRQVITAIANMFDSHAVLSQLHRTVGEMDSSSLSPGQPETYAFVLKRMALELSPGGSFEALSKSSAGSNDQLTVTDSWCLFARPKPSSVWARDATAFADKLMLGNAPELPLATWSLTNGPGAFEAIIEAKQRPKEKSGLFGWFQSKLTAADDNKEKATRPLFPLPTSDAQDQVAELLMVKKYPAVCLEGPPGSGKSHSIANIMCAYLCQGKRVLATSKNAPALSVLRERLPLSVRDLCVDVSTSELTGMRQLQQTVERLANRVSCANVTVEAEKCELLKRNIMRLESELFDLDDHVAMHSHRVRSILQQHEGGQLVQMSREMLSSAPWLLNAIPKWHLNDLVTLRQRVSLLIIPESDPSLSVVGYSRSPSDLLLSFAKARAGSAIASLSVATSKTIAAIPFIGVASGMDKHLEQFEQQLDMITIDGLKATSGDEWKIVVRALEQAQCVSTFQDRYWMPLVQREGWPRTDFFDQNSIRKVGALLGHAVELKRLAMKMHVDHEIATMAQIRALGVQRNRLSQQIQHLAEELVDATVVTELSRSFSPDAQSALIRFAQVAGKAKFNRSSQLSNMTQRQRRRRQEYLDAFDKCCRFIPCWILTTSQISDYLPPEECLFDLVIVDESSQSDVTVLPSLLRGKQWLIVGDGKQVSPTESFISEDTLNSLRAALPVSPLENMLLPGQSFFDLCSQAFPRGRVVLSEHFRCTEEIITFSNRQFYDNRLIPLRLPTKAERLDPPVIDIKLSDGSKSGKVNGKEADKIVEMIMDLTSQPGCPRSIGVISLLGDEQSRLIRGRLLDAIGPEKMSRHSVLVGDPPSFQGAERDVVFLSMVCSKGAVPTQNQMFHAQRANVALSRARDRCVLVRSIGLTDIPSQDDIKISIIEYFEAASTGRFSNFHDETLSVKDRRKEGQLLMKQLLEKKRFSVSVMGAVWRDALCVEGANSDERVAVLVDDDCESEQEWRRGYSQQKAVGRVGWRCLRVSMLSLVYDNVATMQYVSKFLNDAGIEPCIQVEVEVDSFAEEEDEGAGNVDAPPVNLLNDGEQAAELPDANDVVNDDTVFVSSDDASSAASAQSHVQKDAETYGAGRFGQVVDLEFLVRRGSSAGTRSRQRSKSTPPEQKKRRKGAAFQQQRSSGGESSDESSRSSPADEMSLDASYKDEDFCDRDYEASD